MQLRRVWKEQKSLKKYIYYLRARKKFENKNVKIKMC